jgi:hypothetical protein
MLVAHFRNMRVRLTRKLADRIGGVDLTGYQVDDVLDLPSPDALTPCGAVGRARAPSLRAPAPSSSQDVDGS